MDTTRLRELLDQRDVIDEEIALIAASITGRLPIKANGRKQQACSRCGQPGHTSRTCMQPEQQASTDSLV